MVTWQETGGFGGLVTDYDFSHLSEGIVLSHHACCLPPPIKMQAPSEVGLQSVLPLCCLLAHSRNSISTWRKSSLASLGSLDLLASEHTSPTEAHIVGRGFHLGKGGKTYAALYGLWKIPKDHRIYLTQVVLSSQSSRGLYQLEKESCYIY